MHRYLRVRGRIGVSERGVVTQVLCGKVVHAGGEVRERQAGVAARKRHLFPEYSSIAGADVILHRVPGSSLGRHNEKDDWLAVSDANGSFSFVEVNGGLYRLCAQSSAGDWLDPCDWGLPLTSTTLSLAKTPLTVTVVMKKGAVVPVRIDDPGQLLLQGSATPQGAHLLAGVASDTSFFHTLPLVSADSTGRSYQIVIPFDTTVELVISTPLQLANATGVPLASGATALVPVTVPSGSLAPLLRFVVTGAAK